MLQEQLIEQVVTQFKKNVICGVFYFFNFLADNYGRVNDGECGLTSGGKMPCKYVIHGKNKFLIF